MADDGADPADLAGAGQHRRARRRQLLADAVEVQQHQPPRRAAEVVHPRDRLLPAVAALVQVDGGAQPLQLVGDGAVVGVDAEPRPAGLHPQRLVRVQPGRHRAGGEQRVGPLAQPGPRDQQVDDVGAAVADRRHPAHPAAVVGRDARRTAPPAPAARRRPARRSPRGPTSESTAQAVGDQRRLDAEHEHHPLQEAGSVGAGAGLDVGPGRCRRARRATRWCSTCPCGERTQRLGAGAVGQPLEVLAGQAVQPGQPVGPGTASTSRSLRSTSPAPSASGALLAQRVAVVGGHRAAVDARRRPAGPAGARGWSSVSVPARSRQAAHVPDSATWPTSTVKPRSAARRSAAASSSPGRPRRSRRTRADDVQVRVLGGVVDRRALAQVGVPHQAEPLEQLEVAVDGRGVRRGRAGGRPPRAAGRRSPRGWRAPARRPRPAPARAGRQPQPAGAQPLGERCAVVGPVIRRGVLVRHPPSLCRRCGRLARE